MAQEFLQLLLFRLPRLTRQGKVSRDLPLLFVVIFTLTKGVDNQLKIFIPVGTAIINVAAVKYALVSTSKPTVSSFSGILPYYILLLAPLPTS